MTPRPTHGDSRPARPRWVPSTPIEDMVVVAVVVGTSVGTGTSVDHHGAMVQGIGELTNKIVGVPIFPN